jgi:hypothetical protein
MKGIRTSWVPSAQSIPLHADAIILKDACIITSQPALLPPDPRATIISTFEDYLATLPDWDKSLFDGLLMKVSCHKIPPAQASTDTTHAAPYTILVSDGSACDKSMSFGWVLSLHDGTVLARCSGPVPGQELSFRSEGYGMLSEIRFLQHIFEYCHETRAGPFRFITDNQGLIRRAITSLAFDDPYPNSTLATDRDVVNEIVTTLKKMSIEHSFQHVKGHQYDKIAYTELPLNAKLNVNADAEAGEYRYYHPEPRRRVPWLPSNSAQLHIRGIKVSSHYQTKIEKASSIHQLGAYIQDKNNWTYVEMDYINWAAHGKALARKSARKHTTHKNVLQKTSNRIHYQRIQHPLIADVSVLQDSRGRSRPHHKMRP